MHIYKYEVCCMQKFAKECAFASMNVTIMCAMIVNIIEMSS